MTLVRNIVRKLRTPTLRPYDVLYDAMNYWAAFLASTEPGFSIRREVYAVDDAGGLISYQMPLAQPPAPAAARWSVQEMLYQVGLPVKADATRALDGDEGLLKVWQRVYDPELTRTRVEKSWEEWRTLASRVLVNDRNTAFGITLAERPRADGAADDFTISWDRVRPVSVDEMLTHLRYRGEAVGRNRRPPTPSGTTPRTMASSASCAVADGRAANREFFVSTLAKVGGHYVRATTAAGLRSCLSGSAQASRCRGRERSAHVDVDDPPTRAAVVATRPAIRWA
jgi:hypothetical protein